MHEELETLPSAAKVMMMYYFLGDIDDAICQWTVNGTLNSLHSSFSSSIKVWTALLTRKPKFNFGTYLY